MDKLIGVLVGRLDELGIRENTLLVFLGDNGTAPAIASRFAAARPPGLDEARRRSDRGPKLTAE